MSAAREPWVSISEGGEELPWGDVSWHEDDEEGEILYDVDNPTAWIHTTHVVSMEGGRA